ncbi:MAG: hypothetical protein DVB31_12790 [Verrucomicrobia bacterium]|nr:MAG: hypothetical protein DVB31_12790 [Verrucomicrobiota bacterium]
MNAPAMDPQRRAGSSGGVPNDDGMARAERKRDGSDPAGARWADCVGPVPAASARDGVLVGVLPGEGIGPEIVDCALAVARAAAGRKGIALRLEFGDDIGRRAEARCGLSLPGEVVGFCAGIFARGGAILSGAGGGRYVYDLRSRFDLF